MKINDKIWKYQRITESIINVVISICIIGIVVGFLVRPLLK